MSICFLNVSLIVLLLIRLINYININDELYVVEGGKQAEEICVS